MNVASSLWHDEDGEFADAVDGLDLPGVSVVKLNGRNNFAVKRLLSADDYLVYDPLSYEKERRRCGRFLGLFYVE